jgi:hypothetical protein
MKETMSPLGVIKPKVMKNDKGKNGPKLFMDGPLANTLFFLKKA